MKTKEFTLHTDHEGMYNVTVQVRHAIQESGVKSGMAVVYCPHTTAGITINENADPDVQHDLLLGTWQGIYFCEFDGPRTRRFYVKVLADSGV